MTEPIGYQTKVSYLSIIEVRYFRWNTGKLENFFFGHQVEERSKTVMLITLLCNQGTWIY